MWIPTIPHASSIPGMIGLQNSKMWRNQKLIAALLSAGTSCPLQACSTIGAEKRAPPIEGRSPRKAGIEAIVTLVEWKIRFKAATIP